jgi:hypothetical protein
LHYELSANNTQLFGKLPSDNYVETWLPCFREQLKVPHRSFAEFLQRCLEFSLIVDRFSKNYVQLVQQAATHANLQAFHLEQLEKFRDGFNKRLDNLEAWSERFRVFLQSRRQLWTLIPVTFFVRVKSFQIGKLTT